MSALIEHENEFAHFTSAMWNKIIISEHKHKNDSIEHEVVKSHLIKEFLKLFRMDNTLNGHFIYTELMRHDVDFDELVDVANLSFALNLTRDS